MVQDTVDLYAQDYDNGQIFAVTANIEKNIDIVFDSRNFRKFVNNKYEGKLENIRI